MDTLPQELLALITRRLMLRHVSCLARANKKFNTLIWSFVTTITDKELKPVTSEVSLEKFKNLEECLLYSVMPQSLHKLPKLRNLQITLKDTLSTCLVQNLTNLQQLSVDLQVLTNEMPTMLEHTKLTFLSVDAQGINGLDLDFMTRLRRLKLHESGNKSFDGEFIKKLWTLTQLRDLWLSNINESDGAMVSGMSNLTNLETLEIYGCKTQHAHNWFTDYNELVHMRKLTSLSILDVDLNESHTDIISRLTNLEKLELFEITGEFELGLYSNLTKLSHIWVGLDIKKSDPGLEFKQMPNLEYVSIPMCQNVTQLSHLKRLRELFLREGYTDPENHCCKDLSFLKELTMLQKLTLTRAPLPESGYVDLSPLKYLNYIHVMLLGATGKKLATEGFIKGLTAVASLSKLVIGDFFPEYLLPLIALLTQLQVLEVPRTDYAMVRSAGYHFHIESGAS